MIMFAYLGVRGRCGAFAGALLGLAAPACGDDEEARPPLVPCTGPSCNTGGDGGGGGSLAGVRLSCLTGWGDPEAQRVESIASDSNGNLYVTGFFTGTIAIGDTELTSELGFDGFVAKLDSACRVEWAFHLGQQRTSLGASAELRVGVGPDDKPVIAGDVVQGVAIVSRDNATITANGMLPDLFAAKLDRDGNREWSRQLAELATSVALRDVAFGAAGDVHLVGEVDGSSGTLVDEDLDGAAVFVVKLGADDGEAVWERLFPHDGPDVRGAAVAIDGEDGVVVAGDVAGELDVLGETLDSEGESDVFVFKLDSTGAKVWARRYGDAARQQPSDVAVDAMGSVYVGGSYDGVLDIGLTNPFEADGDGAGDAFFFKLTPIGNPDWGIAPAVAGAQSVEALGNAGAHIVVAGRFHGRLDLGGEALEAAGEDGFVATFDSDQAILWSTRVGGAGDDAVLAVAGSPDPPGAVAFGGITNGEVDGPLEDVVSAGGDDALVGKLAPPLD
jgi:hypothetical protein